MNNILIPHNSDALASYPSVLAEFKITPAAFINDLIRAPVGGHVNRPNRRSKNNPPYFGFRSCNDHILSSNDCWFHHLFLQLHEGLV